MTSFREWSDAHWPGLYDWLKFGSSGVSSRTLVAAVCGIPTSWSWSRPYDESDFQRCLGLVRLVPSILQATEALDALVAQMPEWRPWLERLQREAGAVAGGGS